jgi:hypothetical protein
VLLILHCCVFCWLRPVTLSIKALFAGYVTGLATGDLESGCWCIYFTSNPVSEAETPLDAFAADCAFYAERL